MKKKSDKNVSLCREELVYLYRSGELTEEEKISVQEHLTACASCREIYKGLKKYEEAIRWISSENPEMNANALRRTLTEKTSQLEIEERERNAFSFLFSPRVQYLLASVVVFFALLFLYQNIMMVHKVTQLEKHLGAISRIHEQPSTIDIEKIVACLPVLKDGETRMVAEKISPDCRRLLRGIRNGRNILFQEESLQSLAEYYAPESLRSIIMKSYNQYRVIRFKQKLKL